MTHFTQQVISITTFTDSEETAHAIAASLTKNKLAAATHILGPNLSRYWWEGQIQTAEEWIVEAITTHALSEEVAELIKRKHNYALPSITLNHLTTTQPLADWVNGTTKNSEPDSAPACGALPCRETRRLIQGTANTAKRQ